MKSKIKLHIKQKLVGARLSKELSKQYRKRSLSGRKGDTVKIVRGQFKGISGKVDKVSLKKQRIFVEKAELLKSDGSKTKYPIHPSNVVITSLDTSDGRRIKSGGSK